jgi:uncharacterized protein YndB with AHSA1/START domain
VKPAHDTDETKRREVVITRDIDAPAHLLFLAYSRADYVKQWFGPKGWPLSTCEMDFRVGGRFRFAMTGPDGQEGPPFGGEYLEIVPDRKIVYDNGFEGADKMLVTITYEPLGQRKTRLIIHTLFPTIEMYEQHVGYGYAEGIESGMEQFIAFVAGLEAESER